MHDTNLWQGRNPEKDQIRHRIWSSMVEKGEISSSQVGHIPTFHRNRQAAQQLQKLTIWKQANTIKCNPDSAQISVRIAALQSGKRLLMAVPQLKLAHCFISLSAAQLKTSGLTLQEGAIARNALRIGRPISFEEMPKIDLVIVGCVAVDHQGGRTGKGAGFADLELGILSSFGLVDPKTPIATTVDSLQVVDQTLPMENHDWPLDWIVTPVQVINTHTSYPKPKGLNRDSLRADQWETIPILKQIQNCMDL